jgi:hypothetical protein
MSTASAEVTIAMPREQVWDKMRDLSRPHFYVPGVTGCEITTAQREGVGAQAIELLVHDTALSRPAARNRSSG